MVGILHKICFKIWMQGKWAEEWTKSIYVAIHKHGVKNQCSNYKTIVLINHDSDLTLNLKKPEMLHLFSDISKVTDFMKG